MNRNRKEKNLGTGGNAVRDALEKRGFTLAEMVIVLAVSSIILTTLGGSMVMLMKTNMSMNYHADMNLQADRALEQFTADVRDANDIVSLAGPDFVLEFPTDPATRVKYEFHSGLNTLTRIENPDEYNTELDVNQSVTEVTSILMSGVEYLNFTYYDMINSMTSSILDTRKIKINATLVRGNDAHTQVYRDVSTAIYMRNKSGGN